MTRKMLDNVRPRTSGGVSSYGNRRKLTGSSGIFISKPKNILEQCDEQAAKRLSTASNGGLRNQRQSDGFGMESRS
jgi:hypothetical protein